MAGLGNGDDFDPGDDCDSTGPTVRRIDVFVFVQEVLRFEGANHATGSLNYDVRLGVEVCLE